MADVSRLGKEVATFYIGNTAAAAPTVQISAGRFQLNGADAGAASQNVQFGTQSSPSASAATTGWTDGAWCISMTNPEGRTKDYRYSSISGLETGSCSSPTAP